MLIELESNQKIRPKPLETEIGVPGTMNGPIEEEKTLYEGTRQGSQFGSQLITPNRSNFKHESTGRIPGSNLLRGMTLGYARQENRVLKETLSKEISLTDVAADMATDSHEQNNFKLARKS